MNFIAIHGRLVRDPEMRHTQSGVAVTTITVAVDRAYSGDGEKQADFFDCVFWRQGAEFVSKYFTKGKEIIVTGEMQSRKWTDKDGNNRISWEIQNCHAEFCGSAKSSDTAQNTTVQPATSFVPIDEPDAQLPF